MSNKKLNIVLVSCIGDINDSHTYRFIISLFNAGHKISAIRCNQPNDSYKNILSSYFELNKIDFHFWPSGISISTFLKIIILRIKNSFKLFKYLIKNDFDFVVASEPDALFISVISSMFKKSKIIFDIREIFEDRVLSVNKNIQPLIFFLLRNSLRFCNRFVYHIIHVSDHRKNYYKYLKNNSTVVFYYPLINKLKKNNEFSNFSQLIFVHAGALRKNYHSEQMIDAFFQLHMKKLGIKLVIIGGIAQPLSNEDKLNKLIKAGVVKMYDNVQSNKILELLMNCHIGISFVSKVDNSHILAQPRKLYEYFSAALPVLVSENFSIADVVKKYESGWIVDSSNIDLIVSVIEDIYLNNNNITKFGNNAYKSHIDHLNWESQSKKLLNIFND
jgi:glycosyltransferase involved in cell wall biosynthesis